MCLFQGFQSYCPTTPAFPPFKPIKYTYTLMLQWRGQVPGLGPLVDATAVAPRENTQFFAAGQPSPAMHPSNQQ